MSKSKAWSLDWMPVMFSRDKVLDWICENLGKNRKQANQLLFNHEILVKTAPERALIRIDDDPQSWRGRNVQRPTAMVGKPTQGGADNLHNYLRHKVAEWSPDNQPLTFRYITAAELESILVTKYGADRAPTKRKRACDPANQILRYHLNVRRWSWWTAPAPDPEDFETEGPTELLTKRVKLYGDMPRSKHKPGDKFVLEQSECIQWMMDRSGMDLEEVAAEWNRFPFVWVNSVTGESDTERKISRAVVVYDRGTTETLGITTHLAEVKAKPRDSQEEPSSPKLTKQEKRQRDGLAPAGDKEDIRRSDNGYLTIDVNGDFWIGDEGKEKKIPKAIVDDINDMTKCKEKDARRFLKDLFASYSVSIERLVEGLIDLEELVRDGDFLEAFWKHDRRTEKERKEKAKNDERQKQYDEEARKRREEQEKERIQREETDRKIELVARQLLEMPDLEETAALQFIDQLVDQLGVDLTGVTSGAVLSHAIETYRTVVRWDGKYKGVNYSPRKEVKPMRSVLVVRMLENEELTYAMETRELAC